MLDFLLHWSDSPGPASMWAIISFLAGTLIGNRLGIERDWRNEFNGLASPIRSQLAIELGNIRVGAKRPDPAAMHTIIDMAYWWQRKGLREAWIAYEAARQDWQNIDGHVSYARTDHIELSIKRLISLLNRR